MTNAATVVMLASPLMLKLSAVAGNTDLVIMFKVFYLSVVSLISRQNENKKQCTIQSILIFIILTIKINFVLLYSLV